MFVGFVRSNRLLHQYKPADRRRGLCAVVTMASVAADHHATCSLDAFIAWTV